MLERQIARVRWTPGDRIVNDAPLKERVAEHLVTGFGVSASYELCKRRLALLRLIPVPFWSEQRIHRLGEAARSNNQIRDTVVDRVAVPVLLEQLIDSKANTSSWDGRIQ